MINSIKNAGKVIDSIKDKLGNIIYEAWKRLTMSGIPPLTLPKCKGVNLADYKIYGDSVQESKNKLAYPYIHTTRTSGGITFTDNGDGSITLNGTSTATVKFHLQKIILEEYKGYVLSGDYEKGSQGTYWVGMNILGGGDIGDGYTVPSSSVVEDTIVIRIASGQTFENFTIKPQLEKNDKKEKTEWVSQVPLTNAPIEVESVGERTNNLFDEKLLGQVEGYNTYENGIWTTSGLGSYGRDLFYNKVGVNHSVDVSKVPKVTPNTTITIKFHDYANNSMAGTNTLYWHLFNSEGEYVVRGAFNPTNVIVIDVPADAYYISFSRAGNIGTISFSHIQIVEGSYTEATMPDYEPYGYKIPVITSKPNIYKFEDFFREGTATRYVSKIDDNSIKITNNYQCIFTVPNTLFKPNTTYEVSKKLNVISGTSTNTTSRMVLATERTSGGIYIIQGNQSTNEFTTPEDLTNYTYLWVYGIANGEIEINDIIIREKGTVTTNIYSDEPLRKINEYADYIDFEKGIVVRKIREKVFTGNETFNTTIMTNALTYKIDNKIGGNGLCSHFALRTPLPSAEQRYWGGFGVSSLENSGIGFFMVNSPYTQEEFKQYLSKQYLNGTPVKVSYVLETPDDTELINLPNIPTHKGTTIIEVDTTIQPSNMEVQYYGKEVA